MPLQTVFPSRHGSWLLRLTSVNPQFKKLENHRRHGVGNNFRSTDRILGPYSMSFPLCRYKRFSKTGMGLGYFGLLRSTPSSKNLNFRQRTHGLSSGEGRGGMHQEDVLRSGLVWVEIGGVRFFKFLKRGVVGYCGLLRSVGRQAGSQSTLPARRPCSWCTRCQIDMLTNGDLPTVICIDRV